MSSRSGPSIAVGLLGSAALLGGCADDPTRATPTEPSAIVSGFVDEENEYGNAGAFIVRRTSDGRIFPICSGTLISPTVFLTAAHCTADFEINLASSGFTAAVSFDNPIPWGALTARSTRLIPVSQVVTNPAFSQAQDDPGDIGVLVLASRARGVSPAALPSAGLLDRLAATGGLQKAVFTAVGYGVQDRVVGGGEPFFQDRNPLPRMFAFSSFGALNRAYLRLSQNPSTGDGGTCFGDSGGPNFLDVEGTRTLVATTVRGDAVCRSTNVTYRLDTEAARRFLSRFVAVP
jgi:Trypsin